MMRKERVTFLDLCQATQKDLERFFLQPGHCFGDLRRNQLMMEQMAKRTLQMYQVMMRVSINSAAASGEALIQAYFDRAGLSSELYSEGDEPHFCGGPLEKTRLSECQERDKWHRTEENVRARNAKSRRGRSFRTSPRTCVPLQSV